MIKPLKPEHAAGKSDIVRLGMDQNILNQDPFISLGILANKFHIPLPKFYEVVQIMGSNLGGEVRSYNSQYRGGADYLDAYAWIKKSPDEVLEMLQREIPSTIAHYSDIRRLQKELGLDYRGIKEITDKLLETLGKASPAWMIYLREHRKIYRFDGNPNRGSISKPEYTAPTYTSWVQQCEIELQEREERRRVIDDLTLTTTAPGLAERPTQPAGKRPVAKLWKGRESANTVRTKRT